MDQSASTVVAASSTVLWPFLLYSLCVVALLAITLLISWLLGERTPRTAATDLPFESGIVPVGDAGSARVSIEFYLIAMFFVIFDLESIFIFGWVIAFDEVGWAGYAGASTFIGFLLVALVYELRTGALDWGVKQRASKRDRYSRAKGGPHEMEPRQGERG